MSYTTERQPQGIPFSLCNFIRETMIGELVAINDYTEHICLCTLPDVREILHHIAEEEKKHYGMLLNALRKVDKTQCEKAEEVKEDEAIKSKPIKPVKPNKTHFCLLSALRKDIKAELEAIISYEDVLCKIEDPVVKAIIREIVDEEIEHVEELTKIVIKLDTDCYGPIEN